MRMMTSYFGSDQGKKKSYLQGENEEEIMNANSSTQDDEEKQEGIHCSCCRRRNSMCFLCKQKKNGRSRIGCTHGCSRSWNGCRRADSILRNGWRLARIGRPILQPTVQDRLQCIHVFHAPLRVHSWQHIYIYISVHTHIYAYISCTGRRGKKEEERGEEKGKEKGVLGCHDFQPKIRNFEKKKPA